MSVVREHDQTMFEVQRKFYRQPYNLKVYVCIRTIIHIWTILNGNFEHMEEGEFTYIGTRGSVVIDYVMVNEKGLDNKQN